MIALGLLVGVALVAGIMRVKFYFDPPEDNFTNRSNELISAVTEVAMDTVVATPQLVTTVKYNLTQQYDLGDGIILDMTASSDQIWTVQLQGSELVVQAYDQTWVPVADSRHVLQTGVQLIAGRLPHVRLAIHDQAYSLVQGVAESDTVYDVILRRYNHDWIEQSSTVLRNDLSVIEDVKVHLIDQGIWLVVSGGTIELYTYSGILETSQDILIDGMGVCDVIPDQTNLVLVLEGSTTITLQKQTKFGEVMQAVSFPRPNSLVGCLETMRDDEQLIIQLGDSLVPYSDNLLEQYEPIIIQSNQFFPQVILGEDNLWLAYSTSSTLGQYAMHVTTYAVVVTPPDATTEYTN